MRFLFLMVWLYALSASHSVNANEQTCISCHKDQVEDWQRSDHFHAMETATLQNVLGNFDNQTLDYQGQQARFYTDNEKLMITMPDLDGKLTNYPVLYTFGYQPLQQYMFDMGKGKIQLFPFAWDSRTKQQGGQRWFVLHPEQKKHDLFHWSQMGQNWNHMCADCHSTDFKKQFNLKTNEFNSTFSAMNVSCNACHGDTKQHVSWANGDTNIKDKGFTIDITKKTPLFIRQPDGSMKSAQPLKDSQQVQVCATCHARRSQLVDRTEPHNFLKEFQPSLITPELYHVDGQVWDEDYVWGSFEQSKMFAAGVTCSNCHNPHSGKLKLPANQTCTQCHTSEVFDTPKHHGHKVDTTGSQCVDCHMPATTYMQVDARRDHSFRVPRPDLTLKTQAPNACNSCHQNKTPQWAVKNIKAWHPDSKHMGSEHFSLAFHAADNRLPNNSAMLTKIAQSKEFPDIIRASALSRLAASTDNNAIVAIVRAVKENEILKRQAAITAAMPYEISQRWRMINTLLDDEHLAIRSEAARALAAMLVEPFPAGLNETDTQRLNNGLNEYKQIQAYQAERGFSHTNLGNLALEINKPEQAKEHYLTAIRVENIFIPSYVNLADLYRTQGDEKAAKNILQQGLKINPEAADLHYSLAMSYIRTKDKNTALPHLAKAASFATNNANYSYTYALLLQDMGQMEHALTALQKAFQLAPNNPDVSYSLMQLFVKQKNYQQAYRFAKHLEGLVPGNPQIQKMVKQIETMMSLNP
ncbi:multiheme c-type cytochrome [Pseudoalteromonas haloplanktis]|uniref:Multiheme c-type cytochrome n=1 Tax=Pseudoalteromonas haloplanktis TaxID=228 RepID=A0ABU1BI28_PSEHA|nr:tetratricopeptide repeat protein [Pseudoalteromonas haloplanktis]MDQ9093179.1 multiheme c-type cytochrome [Pseudoalteromonas haloplanktis]